MKFRKKPIVIDAIQFDGTNGEEIERFTNLKAHILATHIPIMEIHTLEGNHIAQVGDWIIKGVAGEFYPCKPDIFQATYEPVEEVKK